LERLIRSFLDQTAITAPNTLYNVWEIMETLEVDKDDILLVKNALEDGVDQGVYERELSKGKAWYRIRPEVE